MTSDGTLAIVGRLLDSARGMPPEGAGRFSIAVPTATEFPKTAVGATAIDTSPIGSGAGCGAGSGTGTGAGAGDDCRRVGAVAVVSPFSRPQPAAARAIAHATIDATALAGTGRVPDFAPDGARAVLAAIFEGRVESGDRWRRKRRIRHGAELTDLETPAGRAAAPCARADAHSRMARVCDSGGVLVRPDLQAPARRGSHVDPETVTPRPDLVDLDDDAGIASIGAERRARRRETGEPAAADDVPWLAHPGEKRRQHRPDRERSRRGARPTGSGDRHLLICGDGAGRDRERRPVGAGRDEDGRGNGHDRRISAGE